jgi:hypothetical protein
LVEKRKERDLSCAIAIATAAVTTKPTLIVDLLSLALQRIVLSYLILKAMA